MKRCADSIDQDLLSKFRKEYKKKQLMLDQSKETNLIAENQILNSPMKIEVPIKPQPKDKEGSEILICMSCGKKLMKAKCFTNKKCNHSYCIDCIQGNFKAYEGLCLARNCYKEIDKLGIRNFLERFIINDSTNEIIEVSCKICNEVNCVAKSKDCDLEYLKCIKCSKILCLVHNDLMEKCLCLCPQCVSSFVFRPCFSEKICKKCKLKICLDCKESSQDLTRLCNCKCELCYKQKENISQRFCQFCLNNTNICFGCKEEGELSILYKFQCSHQLCQRCIFDSVIQKTQISKKNQILSIEKLCPVCVVK